MKEFSFSKFERGLIVACYNAIEPLCDVSDAIQVAMFGEHISDGAIEDVCDNLYTPIREYLEDLGVNPGGIPDSVSKLREDRDYGKAVSELEEYIRQELNKSGRS